MDDLISRQAAIDEIRKCRFVVDAIEKIRGLPSAQQWIPCSERLPEEDGEYLCDYNGHLHIGQVINKHFRHYGEIADHLITAWMPLPKPYKEKEE